MVLPHPVDSSHSLCSPCEIREERDTKDQANKKLTHSSLINLNHLLQGQWYNIG